MCPGEHNARYPEVGTTSESLSLVSINYSAFSEHDGRRGFLSRKRKRAQFKRGEKTQRAPNCSIGSYSLSSVVVKISNRLLED